MGDALSVVLPCSKTTTRSAVATRTIAAAIARGSQLRSEGAAGRTSCGPVFTSEIVHPLPKEYPVFKIPAGRRKIFRKRTIEQAGPGQFSGGGFFRHLRREFGV